MTGGETSDGETKESPRGSSNPVYERGFQTGAKRAGFQRPPQLQAKDKNGAPFTPLKNTAPEIHVRHLRGLRGLDPKGKEQILPVDDDGTCRAWYCCCILEGFKTVKIRHRLHTVGIKGAPQITFVYCPENLPEGTTKDNLEPNLFKVYVTRGEGYLAPIFWNEPTKPGDPPWWTYMPKPTKPINAYIEPYYTDPRWWEDSGETPDGRNAVLLMENWKKFKSDLPYDLTYQATFEQIRGD